MRHTALLALLAFAASFPGLQAQEAFFTLEPAEDAGYEVELHSSGSCCPNHLTFLVREKATSREQTLAIEARIQELQHFFLPVPGKLVVQGRLRYGGTIFVIADLQLLEAQDTIWNYGFSFSPSNRFLVYETHYPRMIAAPARRSILQVYDLTASAAANRRGELHERTAPGTPIYPEINARRPSYDPLLDPEHLYLSNHLWSQDEVRLVFMEFFEGQNRLTLIDLTQGFEEPSYKYFPIQRDDFLNQPVVSQLPPEEVAEIRMGPVEIEWKSKAEKVVVVHLADDYKIVPRMEVLVGTEAAVSTEKE